MFLKDHPGCCVWDRPKEYKTLLGDFPGGPVVKTSPSNAGGVGLIPGQGAKISHASRPENQNIKQKQYCNKFNKGFILHFLIKKIRISSYLTPNPQSI